MRTGMPLPEATPGPLLDRLLYHDEQRRARLQHTSGVDSEHDSEHSTVEGAKVLPPKLTFNILKDERFGIYATAILALAGVLSSLDEMEACTKQLVGEVKFPGWEQARLLRDGEDV